MNQCIYYKYYNEKLEYSNQEHVIPAGLGGIKKLPCGFVSNEANNYFSSFELRALRNSLLSINRNNFGPGKRGSLNVLKVRNPVVHIFTAISPEKELDTLLVPYRLGFMFSGVVRILPQIFIKFDEAWNMKRPLYISDNLSKQPEGTLKKFHSSLNTFIRSTDRKYIFINPLSSTSCNFVSIAYHENRFYVCSSIKNFNMDNFCKLITLRALPDINPFLLSSASKYQYNYMIDDVKDVSFPLIYIKSAFNALSLFKGQAFILEDIFDPIRSSICNAGDLASYWVSCKMPSWLVNWVKSNVPPKAHFIVIDGYDGVIDAYVSFFREPLNSTIRITSNYSGEAFRIGLICDWESRKEEIIINID